MTEDWDKSESSYRVVRAALGMLWYISRLLFPQGLTCRLFCPKVIPWSASVTAVGTVAGLTGLLVVRMFVPYHPKQEGSTRRLQWHQATVIAALCWGSYLLLLLPTLGLVSGSQLKLERDLTKPLNSNQRWACMDQKDRIVLLARRIQYEAIISGETATDSKPNPKPNPSPNPKPKPNPKPNLNPNPNPKSRPCLLLLFTFAFALALACACAFDVAVASVVGVADASAVDVAFAVAFAFALAFDVAFACVLGFCVCPCFCSCS